MSGIVLILCVIGTVVTTFLMGMRIGKEIAEEDRKDQDKA